MDDKEDFCTVVSRPSLCGVFCSVRWPDVRPVRPVRADFSVLPVVRAGGPRRPFIMSCIREMSNFQDSIVLDTQKSGGAGFSSTQQETPEARSNHHF